MFRGIVLFHRRTRWERGTFLDVPACGADNREIGIRIERSGSPGAAGRTLELPEPLPDDVDRIVALAVAELVQRGWAELSTPVEVPPEQPAPEPPAAPEPTEPMSPSEDDLSSTEPDRVMEIVTENDEEREAAARRSLGVIAYGAIDGRSFPAHRTGMFGTTASVVLSIASLPLAVELDVGTWFGRSVDPLGTIDIASVRGGVGLLLGGRYRVLAVAVGAHVEAGWARARGTPDEEGVEGSTVDAAVVLIGARGVLGFELVERLGLVMSVDIGTSLLGLKLGADGRRVAGVDGVSFAWSVGLAFM